MGIERGLGRNRRQSRVIICGLERIKVEGRKEERERERERGRELSIVDQRGFRGIAESRRRGGFLEARCVCLLLVLHSHDNIWDYYYCEKTLLPTCTTPPSPPPDC